MNSRDSPHERALGVRSTPKRGAARGCGSRSRLLENLDGTGSDVIIDARPSGPGRFAGTDDLSSKFHKLKLVGRRNCLEARLHMAERAPEIPRMTLPSLGWTSRPLPPPGPRAKIV